MWQKAVADGHLVCNHTYSHASLGDLTGKGILGEITKWEEAAEKILGKEYLVKMKNEFPFIRFPGMSGYKSELVLRTTQKAGYQPIAWSVETINAVLNQSDFKNRPLVSVAEEVRNHVVSSVGNGAIILLHFNPWDTYELASTLEGIRGKGIKLVNLPQVLA